MLRPWPHDSRAQATARVAAARVHDRTGELRRLSDGGHEARIALTRADEVLHPPYSRGPGHPRYAPCHRSPRDFH